MEETPPEHILTKLCTFEKVKEQTIRWFLSDGIAENVTISKSNIKIGQSELSFINKQLTLIGPLYESHSKEQVTLATLRKYYFRKDSLIERLTIDLQDYEE